MLLERWREGDRQAGGVLVSRYAPAVRSYFRSRVSGPDSEDLVQESLSRLTRAIHGFQARSSFRTYVMSIAHNTLNDHLRRGYRRICFESFDDSAGEPAIAEQCLLERERHALALACVRSLSPDHRELVERFYWQDTSARELGREKGIPAGTIRRRLFESRASLKKFYSEATPETLRRVAELEIEQIRSFVRSGAV
ncbi:ECF RNA polymerase sigma-E factor [Enhygromyxa salina]|uniref:ECF RNA polymerase sigma-E factor n=1 Tax=Enhygromyxa salina TaxID=215803 RepID=A0A2S9YS30_9BACT|nr:ECF RNA polymerase sigma-E factor [Enhygromyxa salina]